MLTVEQKQIVQKARDRIADRRRWCTGVEARLADGQTCYVGHPRAAKFCAFGALHRECLAVTGLDGALAMAESVARLIRPDRAPLSDIDDGMNGHAKVLALFDKALAE